jgi:hypothetical protein
MKKERESRHRCAEVQERLRTSWVDGLSKDSTESHVLTCIDCQDEANDLDRLDKSVEEFFKGLRGDISAPTKERIDATLLRLREEPVEVQVLRRIRRPLRIILWGAFYAFTLLAASVLAVALYKAIKGM